MHLSVGLGILFLFVMLCQQMIVSLNAFNLHVVAWEFFLVFTCHRSIRTLCGIWGLGASLQPFCDIAGLGAKISTLYSIRDSRNIMQTPKVLFDALLKKVTYAEFRKQGCEVEKDTDLWHLVNPEKPYETKKLLTSVCALYLQPVASCFCLNKCVV